MYKYFKRCETVQNVDYNTVDICPSFAWHFSRSTGKMNKQCVAFLFNLISPQLCLYLNLKPNTFINYFNLITLTDLNV